MEVYMLRSFAQEREVADRVGDQDRVVRVDSEHQEWAGSEVQVIDKSEAEDLAGSGCSGLCHLGDDCNGDGCNVELVGTYFRLRSHEQGDLRREALNMLVYEDIRVSELLAGDAAAAGDKADLMR